MEDHLKCHSNMMAEMGLVADIDLNMHNCLAHRKPKYCKLVTEGVNTARIILDGMIADGCIDAKGSQLIIGLLEESGRVAKGALRDVGV